MTDLERLETIKKRLQIGWDPLLEVLGIPRRTFFAYRRAGTVPAERQSDLAARSRLLAAAVESDIESARLVIATRRADLRVLLDQARYHEARALFADLRRELQGTPQRDPPYDLGAMRDHIEAITRVAEDPAFEYAAQAVLAIGGTTMEHPVERFRAALELESALTAARLDDAISERWSFLTLMPLPEMDAFRLRAQSAIGSEAFTPGAWGAFLEAEARRARASHPPVTDLSDPTAADERLDPASRSLEARWRRAVRAVGGFRSGIGDVAERHDDHLAEAFAE